LPRRARCAPSRSLRISGDLRIQRGQEAQRLNGAIGNFCMALSFARSAGTPSGAPNSLYETVAYAIASTA